MARGGDDAPAGVAIDHDAGDARGIVQFTGKPVLARGPRRSTVSSAIAISFISPLLPVASRTRARSATRRRGSFRASCGSAQTPRRSAPFVHSDGGRSASAGLGFHQSCGREPLKRRAASARSSAIGRRSLKLSSSARSCTALRWIFNRMLGIGPVDAEALAGIDQRRASAIESEPRIRARADGQPVHVAIDSPQPGLQRELRDLGRRLA